MTALYGKWRALVPGNGVPGDDLWLRLACLAFSLVLNAGFIAVVGGGFGGWSDRDRPIVVSLVERPTPAAARPGPAPRRAPPPAAVAPSLPAPARAGAPAAVARQEPPAPMPTPPVAEAVPVAAPAGETGASAAADGGGGDAALLAGGEGAGVEAGGGDDGQGGDSAGAGRSVDVLIRATPRYEYNPKPEYPAVARQNRWQGTVRVRARVTAEGLVESVALERSSGHASLDRSALDSVRHWRFIPATRGGVAVACDVSIPVAFKLTP